MKKMIYAKMKTPPEDVAVAFGFYSETLGKALIQFWKKDGTVYDKECLVSEDSGEWDFFDQTNENLDYFQDEFDKNKDKK